MPERVAAIDCGTNSLRLLVTDIEPGAKTDVLREMRVVRLGQGVDTSGELAEEAIDRTLESTREYARLIEPLGVATVRFCATSAVRDAANAERFLDGVEEILGVRPEILTGDAEARASFDGATRELGDERIVLVDLGGGSTEIVVGRHGEVEDATSLDIGSVRLTERFFAGEKPTVPEVSACLEYVDEVVAPVASELAPADTLVGVAGTITTIAAHALRLPSYDPEQLHLAAIGLEAMADACTDLAGMSLADRRALPYMHPGRADVIGAGALILDRLIARLPVTSRAMVISEQDILDGIAWGAATTGR